MKLIVTLHLDNAAFDPKEAEVARILREYADALESDYLKAKVLRDVNGNTVGTVRLAR